MKNPFPQIASALRQSQQTFDPAKQEDAKQKEEMGIMYDPTYEREQAAKALEEKEQRRLEEARKQAEADKAKQLAAVDGSALKAGQRQATQVKVGEEFKATKGYDPSKGSGMFSGIADYVGANVDDYAQLANKAYKENYLQEGEETTTFEEAAGVEPDGFGKLSRLMLEPYKGPTSEKIQQTPAEALDALRGLNLSPGEYAKQESRIKAEHEQVYQAELDRITADLDKKLAAEELVIKTQMEGARTKLAETTAKQDAEVTNLDAKLTESLGEAVSFSLLTEFKSPKELQGFIDSKGGDRYLKFLSAVKNMNANNYDPKSVPSEFRQQYEQMYRKALKRASVYGYAAKPAMKAQAAESIAALIKNDIEGYRGN